MNKRVAWLYVMGGLALLVMIAATKVGLELSAATDGATTAVPIDTRDYVVEQTHEKGEYVQVRQGGRQGGLVLHLECININCAELEEGETIQLQVECANSNARLFLKRRDGDGEYFYHTESYKEDQKVCPYE